MISRITLSIVLILSSAVFAQQFTGIGSNLFRTFEVFNPVPMNITEAENSGWTVPENISCNNDLGIPMTLGSGPTKSNPLTAFYTAGGQIAGIGMTHFGTPVSTLTQFWNNETAILEGTAFMSATFRAPGNICTSGYTYQEELGTQVVINQGGVNFAIPLTENDATNAKFTKGSCIGKMGTHWSYDLQTAPEMSWEEENLMPVVPMYSNGDISAFFFTTPVVQLPEPLGDWEGPFIPSLFCLNWCTSNCTWDATFISTLHFIIDNPSDNVCSSRC